MTNFDEMLSRAFAKGSQQVEGETKEMKPTKESNELSTSYSGDTEPPVTVKRHADGKVEFSASFPPIPCRYESSSGVINVPIQMNCYVDASVHVEQHTVNRKETVIGVGDNPVRTIGAVLTGLGGLLKNL